MNEEDIEAFAVLIREGKATDDQKIQFLKALNLELSDISDLLKKVPKNINK
jgi:hypothetical protein